ncbi:hypothetical protein Leryth_024874 [Lithospermum erythrorhizon]|nr:hypothetical protein Leryth_024874 [Lithospermum erythrorhizon]
MFRNHSHVRVINPVHGKLIQVSPQSRQITLTNAHILFRHYVEQ